MTWRGKVAIVSACLFVGTILYPQAPATASGIHIADLMSASEFRNAGLSKLTPTELASLDSWLNSYLLRLITRVTQRTAPSAQTASVIESEIDGDFNGWDGETIFKLSNGQIWQQAEYDYEYEYAYDPKVTIFKTSSGYKMKVEGMDDTIVVKRLK